MKKKYFFFLFLFKIIYGQEKNTKSISLIELNEKFIEYESKGNYDSIIFIINNFKNQKNLGQYEEQVAVFFEAMYNYRINRLNKAIELFEYSKKISVNTKKSKNFINYSNAYLSDIYFTKKKYKIAYDYAILCKPHIPIDIIVEYINIHSIIGYYHFLNKNYKLSLIFYFEAVKAIEKSNESCKYSEIYPKIAKSFAGLNNIYKAKKYIQLAIKESKKCNTITDEINVRYAWIDILKDKKKYLEVLDQIDTINILNEKADLNNRNIKFDELETKYKTKLKEQENSSLKKINLAKEINIKNQKKALIGTICTIIFLFLLLVWILRLRKVQKKQSIIIDDKNKILYRLNTLNQKIFSVISHDFKIPISSLRVILEKDETHNIYIKEINNQLIQSENILSNLLDWAKSELNQDFEKNEFSIHVIVKQVLDSVDNLIKNKNIIIRNNIEQSLIINFNKSILTIVLRNIINNAIKYSFENGLIEITFKNNIISVRDFGKGISNKVAEKLLNNRVNSGLGTNLESGYGIGLYMCNELIKKSNGEINFIQHEKGTEFIIKVN